MFWCGVLAGLFEEHHNSSPKLVGPQTDKTHEKEHPIKNRDGDQFDHIQCKYGSKNKYMDEKVGQSRFLYVHKLSIGILISQCMKMIQGANSGSNQPW